MPLPSTTSALWKRLISTYSSMEIEYPDLRLVTLAQWALESGWARSELAKKHNNFGGLKYRARMEGRASPVDYEAHDGIDTYCAFDSVEAFIAGYWHFVASGPYEGWQEYGADPLGYIQHLRSKGYAGDPNYVAKIAALYQDLADAGTVPDAPEIDRPPRRLLGDAKVAVFEPVAGIEHPRRGRYPNGVEGLIVHYDAFRIRRLGGTDENSDTRTIQMIKSGADNGYRYAEISRTGRIFVPANWDFEHWGRHAGTSRCPVTGRTSVSQYYVGVEMNNPGLLYESQTDGEFCPWYNCRQDAEGRIIRDSRGRCYRKSSDDETYTRDEVRYAKGGNIAGGYYLPYSRDQFDSLVAIIAHLRDTYPASFRLDRIFGHDEVSPGRKQDPGGALSYDGRLMTMDEFRTELAASL